MSDWTGSSRQRREQGLCLPPANKPNKTARFVIPAGTSVNIASVMNSRWFAYETRIDLEFSRFEQRKNGFYYFRHLGWLIRVPKHLTRQNTTA